MIGPLRAHVRETLSDSSPGLRQLASLDAVWEQMLEARERGAFARGAAGHQEIDAGVDLATHQFAQSLFV